MINSSMVKLFVVFLAVGLLSGCMKEKEEVVIEVDLQGVIQVSEDVNPGFEGRPSPIVVRIYQLKSVDLFEKVDFFSIYDDEKTALSDPQLVREELDLQPGETIPYIRSWGADANYIGVVVAFRDLDNAKWRSYIALPEIGAFPFIINVDSRTVSISKVK
ncbi:MAG: type VI secretion system lipoprotein TssJ [Sedimenticola sp.]